MGRPHTCFQTLPEGGRSSTVLKAEEHPERPRSRGKRSPRKLQREWGGKQENPSLFFGLERLPHSKQPKGESKEPGTLYSRPCGPGEDLQGGTSTKTQRKYLSPTQSKTLAVSSEIQVTATPHHQTHRKNQVQLHKSKETSEDNLINSSFDLHNKRLVCPLREEITCEVLACMHD